MKTNYLALCLMVISFNACQTESPVQLTYNDIYGYDYSATAKPSNGVFFIKSANQLTFQESNRTDSTAAYTMVTTGTNPFFTTAKIGGVVNSRATVLSFKYKTDQRIIPTINLDITKTDATGIMSAMEVSSEWKEFSWDLGASQGLIALNSWGGVGSYFRFSLKSDNPAIPANIQIKDIKFRKRTESEEAFANAGLWLTLTDKDGGDFTGFTDITSQEGGFNLFTHSAYTFKLSKNSNFIRTLPLSRAFLPNEQNHIKFEYKCDIQTSLLIFVNVPNFVGPAAINPLPASSVWKTVDYDFTNEVNFPQSSYTANPIQMSFYYPGNESPNVSIRGMHFYTK